LRLPHPKWPRHPVLRHRLGPNSRSGIRLERLRCLVAWTLQLAIVSRRRDHPDSGFSDRHPRLHIESRTRGLCTDRDRIGVDTHSLDLDSRYQYLGQSGSLDGRRGVRADRCIWSIVVVLACSAVGPPSAPFIWWWMLSPGESPGLIGQER
jgi:hypothetical protein